MVLDKFKGRGFELDRATTLRYIKRQWQNWRGLLKRDHVKGKKSVKDILDDKNVPEHFCNAKEDWVWLVKEHFLKDKKHLKRSGNNSENRSFKKMPHRTGSMSFSQLVYDHMGGKEGNSPSISEIFLRSRTKRVKQSEEAAEDTILEAGDDTESNDPDKIVTAIEMFALDKYVEIMGVEKEFPNLTRFEVVEKCFGPQDRDHVVCFGSCMRPKDVRGPLPPRDELTRRLQQREQENGDLRKIIEEMEASHNLQRAANEKKIDDLSSKVDALMDLIAKHIPIPQ